MDLQTIEKLMQLMTRHRISEIEVEGIRLTKNLHTAPMVRASKAAKQQVNPAQERADSDEAILFGATDAPAMDPALFSANGFHQ